MSLDEPAAVIQLLRRQKAKLIGILSGDADFVLQHADSLGLLSDPAYQQVKARSVPTEKVTELLDHVIQRGPEQAEGLLKLLRDDDLQKTFPMLHFIKDLHVDPLSSSGSKETQRKRESASDLQVAIPSKKICANGPGMVSEKQLMTVARCVGKCWKEVGRLALDVPSVKLEQIEEEERVHVERVFAMLRYWRNRQREKATAAHLHSLLGQQDCALPPESIDSLLDAD